MASERLPYQRYQRNAISKAQKQSHMITQHTQSHVHLSQCVLPTCHVQASIVATVQHVHCSMTEYQLPEMLQWHASCLPTPRSQDIISIMQEVPHMTPPLQTATLAMQQSAL